MGYMPETAMVLAAGLGTRMRPLTNTTPKPLIKVAGKALLDYTLERFVKAGVKRTIVNVHYLADQIEDHLQTIKSPEIILSEKSPEIILSDERDLLLETGGGLKKARPHFSDQPLFCTNTDAIMLDGDAEEACAVLAEAWRHDQMDALLLLVPMENTSGYDGKGDFARADDGQISLRSGDHAPYVFTGLQIISPTLIDEGPEGPFSTKLLWEKAIARGRLYGALYEGFWMHVGDKEGLAAAEARITHNPSCP